MKKKMKRKLGEAAGVLVAVSACAALVLLVTAVVWILTDWEIQDVVYVAVTLSLVALYASYTVLEIRRHRTRVRLIEQKRAAQKRWDSFQDIIIKGEFIEVEDPETGLTEIRNIVAKE